MKAVTLVNAGWSAAVSPGLGGAITRLDWNGAPVLRAAAPEATDILEMASFPLVPYANRIAHGRFAGIQLALNFGDHPHSLHGTGWQSEWAISEQTDAMLRLRLESAAGKGWPWAFVAEQTVELLPGAARFCISLANRDATPMPAGLGFHPYFPLHAESRLMARAARVWLGDETMLPKMAAPADHFGDWSAGGLLSGGTLIDNAYEGWDGAAIIEQPGHRIRLSASGARAFHLYRPGTAGFFCFEPVSHLPDAHNRAGLHPEFALDTLAPGETLNLSMQLEISRS